MASGSEDICPRSIEEKDEHPKNKTEKIEELVTELEGYRWDAILLNETWRHKPAELWETHITNTSSWELEHTTTNTGLELC